MLKVSNSETEGVPDSLPWVGISSRSVIALHQELLCSQDQF